MWVKSSANRLVFALDHDTGQQFAFLVCSHLIFAIFPFPVNAAQLVSEFWKNSLRSTSDVAAKRGALTVPIGSADHSRYANKTSRIFLYSSCLPVSGVKLQLQ
jgi:hypothetical protein